MSEMEEEMKVGSLVCAPRAEPSSTGPSGSHAASGRRGRDADLGWTVAVS